MQNVFVLNILSAHNVSMRMGIITLSNMFNKQTGFSDESYEGRRETDQQICSTKQISNNENIYQYIQRQTFN